MTRSHGLAAQMVIGASRTGSDLSVDLADKASIVSMYQQLGTVDAVICAAGAVKFAPFADGAGKLSSEGASL